MNIPWNHGKTASSSNPEPFGNSTSCHHSMICCRLLGRSVLFCWVGLKLFTGGGGAGPRRVFLKRKQNWYTKCIQQTIHPTNNPTNYIGSTFQMTLLFWPIWRVNVKRTYKIFKTVLKEVVAALTKLLNYIRTTWQLMI